MITINKASNNKRESVNFVNSWQHSTKPKQNTPKKSKYQYFSTDESIDIPLCNFFFDILTHQKSSFYLLYITHQHTLHFIPHFAIQSY